MQKWIKYLIVTITLPLIGWLATGFASAHFFFESRGFLFSLLITVFLLLVSPVVFAYLSVSPLSISWWYPSIVISIPGLALFFWELLTPRTHPYILLLPISVLIMLALGGGRLGHKHVQTTNA